MNFKTLLALTGLVFVLAACSKDQLTPDTQNASKQQPMSRAEMDAIITQHFEKNNTVYYWSGASNTMLWSASVRSDSMMSVGYQPAGSTDVLDRIHLIDLNSPEWKAVRKKTIDYIVDATNEAYPDLDATAEDLIRNLDRPTLPTLDVKIFDLAIIEKLRGMPEIRYIEPMGYGLTPINQRSDSGCSNDPASSIPSADYTNAPPSAKISWHLSHNSMNVPTAWNTSTGSGIKVALIDTGVADSQSKLGSQFNSGYSSGRSIQKLSTLITGWWWWASNEGPNDQCGHGTAMAGLIASPRGYGGAATGVAYNCNLKSYRGTSDVVVNGSNEKEGVRDALYSIGNDNSVKIVSMSIGDVFYSSTVADGIYYAYNKGKLIFAAAGTSFSWTSWWGVIFPGNMAQTVAVTGIKDNYTSINNMQRCNICHSGSEVDFVAVMQRSSNNDRTTLTLAMSGNTPSYVGGSSAATATTAGIAALVWATNPGQSRSQVLQRLKNASSYYPNRDGDFGWGTINAAAAVQ
jgi:subtilisin family serine protease